MSESTASSSDLDNVPLGRLMNQGDLEMQNLEADEYADVTSEFVSECQNDGSNTGTVSDEESENDALATDEVPIDIQQLSDQKQSGSWPTLEILPGGVIQLAEKEYPMNIYGRDAETEDKTVDSEQGLMYACAKCPRRFRRLYCLVRHVRAHEDERKRAAGDDLTRLTPLERDLIFLKRSRTDMEKQYKRKKLDVMTSIAASMVHMDRIIENFE